MAGSEEKKPRGYQAGLVVCLIVIAMLGVGFVWTYLNQLNQINALNKRCSDLQEQVWTLQILCDKQRNILDMMMSKALLNRTTITQSAGSYSYWTFSIEYNGLICVNVIASTSTSIYVQVSHDSSYMAAYNSPVDVRPGSRLYFPVIHLDNVEVRIGNRNLTADVTITVEIWYTY